MTIGFKARESDKKRTGFNGAGVVGDSGNVDTGIATIAASLKPALCKASRIEPRSISQAGLSVMVRVL